MVSEAGGHWVGWPGNLERLINIIKFSDIVVLTTYCHHFTGPGLAPGQLVPHGEGLSPEQVCPVSLSQEEMEAMYKHCRQVSHFLFSIHHRTIGPL